MVAGGTKKKSVMSEQTPEKTDAKQPKRVVRSATARQHAGSGLALEALMFWLALGLVSGGAYLAVGRFGLLIAGSVLLAPAILFIAYVDQAVGILPLVIGSLEKIVGVSDLNQAIPDCPPASVEHSMGFLLFSLAVSVLLLGVAFLLVFVFLGALVALPVGAASAVGGAVWTLATRDRTALAFGLAGLAVGAGLVLVGGLTLRLMAVVVLALC